MNTNGKRGRGRPRGTGLNDTAILIRIADMVARAPQLRPTPALRRIEPDANPATIRRIQAKWRAQGSRLLGDACARLATRRDVSAPARSTPSKGVAYAQNVFDQALRARWVGHSIDVATLKAMTSPALQAMRDMHDSPAVRAMREMHDSPAVRAMREMHDSPAMRAMREMHDSPAMRAMREMHDGPAMRAMREMHDSPAMRAIREMHDSPAIRSMR